jgi:hypothetical protein
VAGCKPADASRLGVIVTGMRGGVLLTEELLANGLPIDGISGSLVGGIPSSNPLAVPADPVRCCFVCFVCCCSEHFGGTMLKAYVFF